MHESEIQKVLEEITGGVHTPPFNPNTRNVKNDGSETFITLSSGEVEGTKTPGKSVADNPVNTDQARLTNNKTFDRATIGRLIPFLVIGAALTIIFRN